MTGTSPGAPGKGAPAGRRAWLVVVLAVLGALCLGAAALSTVHTVEAFEFAPEGDGALGARPDGESPGGVEVRLWGSGRVVYREDMPTRDVRHRARALMAALAAGSGAVGGVLGAVAGLLIRRRTGRST
jgi:hypothetical protein